MSPMNNTALVFVSLVAAFVFISTVNGAAFNRDNRSVVEIEDPEYVLELLQKLGQSIIRANELEKKFKRNQMIDLGLSGAQAGKRVQMLDLGLGRGFSGAQAGKHLIGLLAASAAGGPGRRRRSLELPEVHLQHQLTASDNLSPANNPIVNQNTE